MTIRAGQINATSTLTRDNDLGSFGYSLYKDFPGGGAVLEGLSVTTGNVAVGTGLVCAIRTSTTPNEKFLMPIHVTVAEPIDTSGTKKIWLEPIQDNVNDPTLNTNADGTGIAQLNSGADWPATPHIRLASTVAGVITDERVFTKSVAELTRDNAFNSATAAGTGSAYTLTLIPAPTAYATRMGVIFTAPAQSLSGVTLNINGLGAKTLKLPDGSTDIPDGYILSGQLVWAVYDGTNFRIISAPYTGFAKASSAQIAAGVDDSLFATPLGLQGLNASAAEVRTGSETKKFVGVDDHKIVSGQVPLALTTQSVAIGGTSTNYSTAIQFVNGGYATLTFDAYSATGVNTNRYGFQTSPNNSVWTTQFTEDWGGGSTDPLRRTISYTVPAGYYVRVFEGGIGSSTIAVTAAIRAQVI